jgi:DNA-directed RNA polymerase specialized sigma24 family protein
MDARALVESLQGERARFVQMARARVRSEADAEDVVQRAMLRAAEHAGDLADPARARAWFYRILRRAIVDHHRARPREESAGLDVDMEAPEGEAPLSPCACAGHLLAELRPAYAEVLRRVDFEGEGAEGVAAALGVSKTNLYVRLHRARQALRGRVEEHCGVRSLGPCLQCSCGGRERCGSEG